MLRNIYKILPLIFMAALMVGNVLLLKQNLSMRSELNKLRPSVLKTGDRVNDFFAKDRTGNSVSISFTGKETTRVFFYFAPACPYCQEQFFYWRQVLDKANQNQYQLIGVVADSEDQLKLTEYMRTTGCDSMRVILAPPDVRRQYKLSMTPMTVVVDNNGIIKYSWIGKWDGKVIDEASDLFGFEFETHLGQADPKTDVCLQKVAASIVYW